MPGKYYFIGDIHGCADELEELILRLNLRPEDQLISVGDIINKGPRSEEAVQLLIKYNALAVLGNHDLLVKYVHDEKKGLKVPFKLKKSHYKLYDSLSKSSLEYILSLPYYIILKEINTLVVHAGLLPGKKPEAHTAFEITSIRILDPVTKKYIKRDQKGYPWYYYYNDSQRVIYGHSAAQSIKLNKNTVGIDTGCLYGGRLTAYILPDERFVYVTAKKAYEDYSQGGKYKIPR